ncbi:unnamed protein product [Rangifer tarandus platyrhynchus]|uniref:Uncharacterized protein n=1 Tax=Rangifer tarandus platyrhynchus TaxID=3082113 RepID=A0AC59Z453_RANTA
MGGPGRPARSARSAGVGGAGGVVGARGASSGLRRPGARSGSPGPARARGRPGIRPRRGSAAGGKGGRQRENRRRESLGPFLAAGARFAGARVRTPGVHTRPMLTPSRGLRRRPPEKRGHAARASAREAPSLAFPSSCFLAVHAEGALRRPTRAQARRGSRARGRTAGAAERCSEQVACVPGANVSSRQGVKEDGRSCFQLPDHRLFSTAVTVRRGGLGICSHRNRGKPS